MTDIKTLAQKTAGFITHYGTELLSITGVVSQLVDHLPIDPGTKENIKNDIDVLNKGAEAALAGASSVAKAPASNAPVTVKKSDVEAAVAELLPALVEKAVADALAKNA